MNIRFEVGNDGRRARRELDGCGLVSLADIERACQVLGLTIESISAPGRSVGSHHQWVIDVRLDGERVQFVGDAASGLYDFRDIGWAEQLMRSTPGEAS